LGFGQDVNFVTRPSQMYSLLSPPFTDGLFEELVKELDIKVLDRITFNKCDYEDAKDHYIKKCLVQATKKNQYGCLKASFLFLNSIITLESWKIDIAGWCCSIGALICPDYDSRKDRYEGVVRAGSSFRISKIGCECNKIQYILSLYKGSVIVGNGFNLVLKKDATFSPYMKDFENVVVSLNELSIQK
jgi:hypothetical protein